MAKANEDKVLEKNRDLVEQQKIFEKTQDASKAFFTENSEVRKVLKDPNSRKEILNTVKKVFNEGEFTKKKIDDRYVKKIHQLLDDDEKVSRSVQSLNPANRKKPGIKDQLVSALLLMTPQILGTLIGGAVGGGDYDAAYEGAQEGEANARKLMEANQDMREQELDIERKERALDEGDEENMTTAQKVRSYQNMADYEQRERRDARLQTQGDLRIKVSKDSLALRKISAHAFTSPVDREKLFQYQALDRDLNDVFDLLDSNPTTGFFVGNAKATMQKYGILPGTNSNDLRRKLSKVLAMQLLATSGKAVNEGERKVWNEQIAATIEMDTGALESTLRRLQKENLQNAGIFVRTGRDYGAKFKQTGIEGAPTELENPVLESRKAIKDMSSRGEVERKLEDERKRLDEYTMDELREKHRKGK